MEDERSKTALRAAALVGKAITSVIPEKGIGTSTLYAALMGKISLSNFNAILDALQAAGAIVIDRHSHTVKRGPKWKEEKGI